MTESTSVLFCEKALELVKELERNPEQRLPPYNDTLVRQVLQETQSLFDENQADVQTIVAGRASGLHSTLLARHSSIERNKRCLVAYSTNRLARLRDLRWEVGSVIPSEIKRNLSDKESEWFQEYNRILASYMRSLGDYGGLDLTDYQKPPQSLYVEVRVLEDYGDFETSEGTTVILKQNSMHSLPRADCEQLIRQGVLEPLQA